MLSNATSISMIMTHRKNAIVGFMVTTSGTSFFHQIISHNMSDPRKAPNPNTNTRVEVNIIKAYSSKKNTRGLCYA